MKTSLTLCHTCGRELMPAGFAQSGLFFCSAKCQNAKPERDRENFQAGDFVVREDETCLWKVTEVRGVYVYLVCAHGIMSRSTYPVPCENHRYVTDKMHRDEWVMVTRVPCPSEYDGEDKLFPDSIQDAGDLHFEGFDSLQRLQVAFASEFENLNGMHADEK